MLKPKRWHETHFEQNPNVHYKNRYKILTNKKLQSFSEEFQQKVVCCLASLTGIGITYFADSTKCIYKIFYILNIEYLNTNIKNSNKSIGTVHMCLYYSIHYIVSALF